ncbi:hypothetical protein PR048_007994 [Dryococelus australis]|uniref:Uncharacterized protein n=1 Tax=Dryococelus australis TaxID=614101 RepID=A0ABQ9HXH6_9NEOP|nr:hypothetical protein PR048_007994 [Dryococelus australis]
MKARRISFALKSPGRDESAEMVWKTRGRLVLQADAEDPATWLDLYRLVPYLRQSLSCTVCGNLLIQPYTPTESNCQHHVCRSCKGGRKKLKPTCSWCKNYEKYIENVQLRILLQCYKKLCEYVLSTALFSKLTIVGNSVSSGTTSLKDLIHEGAGFRDVYKSQAGLSKSAYSILPCIYTSTSTQTQTALAASRVQSLEQPMSQNNGLSPLELLDDQSLHPETSLYSVMYPGDGNKITIKRKGTDFDQSGDGNSWSGADSLPLSSFKKMPQQRAVVSKMGSTGARSRGGARNINKRKGCRCGNATPTPGKLTCCGQRCPCYVASKACMECRCRGCRNPHRPGGQKVTHADIMPNQSGVTNYECTCFLTKEW